jgi:hypothetical protein
LSGSHCTWHAQGSGSLGAGDLGIGKREPAHDRHDLSVKWVSRRRAIGPAADPAAGKPSVSPAAGADTAGTGGPGQLPTQARLISERRRSRREPEGGSVAERHAAKIHAERLDERSRGQLAIALENHVPRLVTGSPHVGPEELMARLALNRVAAVRGDLSLRPSGAYDPTWFQAVGQYVLEEEDALLTLDVIGAWADAYARLPGTRWLREAEQAFLAEVSRALRGSAFAVSGREIVRRDELGAALLVDEPVAALLVDDPALRAVDDKLREALQELEQGRPADAVTDAGTALQMLLEHLGYSGKQLGEQLAVARKDGWLNGVDAPLAQALDAIGRWVASVRNQRGDAHHGPEPDARDAEFVVRMVGLLVLRFGQ